MISNIINSEYRILTASNALEYVIKQIFIKIMGSTAVLSIYIDLSLNEGYLFESVLYYNKKKYWFGDL